MKAKMLLLALGTSVLASAAWFAQSPSLVHAYDIPEKYRETASKGLEYLVKNQKEDGHWEGDDGKHPVAMTGLVGLALLMEQDVKYRHGWGEMAPVRKYSAEIKKAADWLIDKADAWRGGLIYAGHGSEIDRYMQGHGLATLFLAGVYKDGADDAQHKKLADILGQAVKYIVSAQSSQGGWYRTSKAEGHDFDEILATAIQMQALQAAEIAGIPVPSEAVNDGKGYLIRALQRLEDKSDPALRRSRQMETAAALIALFNHEGSRFVNIGGKKEHGDEWFKQCRDEIPVGRAIEFGRDELIHHWFAQVMYDRGGDLWSNYRTAMFDHLQSRQNKDGSWPASDGIGVGPVYATALWCIVLQLDKKSHPSRRWMPVDVT
jgi:hypothetical protein